MGSTMWWTHEWGWGSWALMAVLMVAFWTLLAWAFWALFGAASRQAPTDQSAEEILTARYARGEIGTEEFERRRDVLRAGRH